MLLESYQVCNLSLSVPSLVSTRAGKARSDSPSLTAIKTGHKKLSKLTINIHLARIEKIELTHTLARARPH